MSSVQQVEVYEGHLVALQASALPEPKESRAPCCKQIPLESFPSPFNLTVSRAICVEKVPDLQEIDPGPWTAWIFSAFPSAYLRYL